MSNQTFIFNYVGTIYVSIPVSARHHAQKKSKSRARVCLIHGFFLFSSKPYLQFVSQCKKHMQNNTWTLIRQVDINHYSTREALRLPQDRAPRDVKSKCSIDPSQHADRVKHRDMQEQQPNQHKRRPSKMCPPPVPRLESHSEHCRSVVAGDPSPIPRPEGHSR